RHSSLVRSACGVAWIVFLTASCSSEEVPLRLPSVDFSAPAPSVNASGEPGPGVTVYDFSNGEYFEVHPGGAVTVRPGYEKAIATRCDVGQGRACDLGVGIPTGSACFCKSVWGPIWGHAP